MEVGIRNFGEAAVMDLEIQKNIVLAPYTSWQVGGVAQYFCLPKNLEELQEAREWSLANGVPAHILGGGSNVLVSDKGVQGLVICLKKFSGTHVYKEDERLIIEALAGTSKSEILKIFLKYKLAPALFLAGIPGDVGGGVVMNAGVAENFRPREFFEIIDWVEVLKPDGEVQRYDYADIQWSYRHSIGWQPGVITRVGLSWPLEQDEGILEQVKTANKTRLSKQPLDMPSCGSVFVNPAGTKAAQLIDGAGLKGFSIGDAQVSMKHANFIVNTGSAKASDISAVIEHVRTVVKEKFGIELKTEVALFGEW
jgi:UDP-N-acetylmuramate dehydrogenase